jgi:hypothetical protein
METLRAFECSNPDRMPGACAAEALRASSNWFDGIEPATRWVLVWYETVCDEAALRPAMSDGTRTGYRLGRLLLGDDAQPSLGLVSYTDLFAEAMFEATVSIDHPTFFEALPESTKVEAVVASHTVRRRWEPMVPAEAHQRLSAASLFGIDAGLALALAEHVLVG